MVERSRRTVASDVLGQPRRDLIVGFQDRSAITILGAT